MPESQIFIGEDEDEDDIELAQRSHGISPDLPNEDEEEVIKCVEEVDSPDKEVREPDEDPIAVSNGEFFFSHQG